MTNLLSRLGRWKTSAYQDKWLKLGGKQLFSHTIADLSQTFAGLGKFSTHTKVRDRAKVSVFQLLPAWFYLFHILWNDLNFMSSFPMDATVHDSFFSARNCLTKILFMKFCWIQYAKKIDSSALSLEPAFMNT